MSSGRTGTRVSAAPVAARSADTIAGVEEIVGGSPTAAQAVGRLGVAESLSTSSFTGGMSSTVGIR